MREFSWRSLATVFKGLVYDEFTVLALVAALSVVIYGLRQI